MLGNSTILSAMHNNFSDKNAIFHTFYALCANELGISKKRVFWPQKKKNKPDKSSVNLTLG